jgi:HK97 family phage prohead protease
MPKPLNNSMVLAGAIQAATLNEEDRTVEVMAYAGAVVPTWEGDYTLDLKPAAVDLSRVKRGAGVFMDHDTSIESQVGVIDDGRVEEDKGLMLSLRFARDEESDRCFQNVKDGIFQNLSIGAFVLRKKETTADGAMRKTFLATKWQPFEVSLVGVPADPNARFLSQEKAPECELETEVQGSAPDQPEQKGESAMPDTLNVQGQTLAPNPEAISAAVQAERLRVSEINRICAMHNMGQDFVAAAIAEGSTLEAVRGQILDKIATRTEQHLAPTATAAATVIRDQADTRRELMASAVMNRINPGKYQVESGNDYRHMSCLRLAEESLVQSGLRVRGLSPSELAIKAMQQTSDFANVLENSARKLLLDRYAIANPTYKLWAKASTTPDFKTMSRSRLSETPSYLKVPEGAQITIGTMSDSKEAYSLATYGRGVSFTRQMLINDDLGAFNDIIARFGDQAAILENTVVYSILTTNAAMADSTALFHANHGNLGTGVIANTGLDAGFTAMAIQKGLDGVSVLNIQPKFFIVPAAKRATAETAMMSTGNAVKAADQNMFAGRLQVVADGVLDATSTAVWYFAADPNLYPGVEYAHLEGATGPQIIRKEDESGALGVNLYAFLDFGAKAVDWRPLYKSSGS